MAAKLNCNVGGRIPKTYGKNSFLLKKGFFFVGGGGVGGVGCNNNNNSNSLYFTDKIHIKCYMDYT